MNVKMETELHLFVLIHPHDIKACARMELVRALEKVWVCKILLVSRAPTEFCVDLFSQSVEYD